MLACETSKDVVRNMNTLSLSFLFDKEVYKFLFFFLFFFFTCFVLVFPLPREGRLYNLHIFHVFLKPLMLHVN